MFFYSVLKNINEPPTEVNRDLFDLWTLKGRDEVEKPRYRRWGRQWCPKYQNPLTQNVVSIALPAGQPLQRNWAKGEGMDVFFQDIGGLLR